MTIDTAKLRELAQAVLDTQGADHACLAYHNHLTGMHPADVLAMLDENARLREAQTRSAKALAWLRDHPFCELDWGCVDEDEDAVWRVHRRSGNKNDREWTLIGTGGTPLAAIEAARAALKGAGR